MTGKRAHLALIAAAACWGLTNVAAKSALDAFPAMTLLVIELASATGALWIVLLVRGHRRPARMGRFALLGLLEPCLTYAAVNLGLVYTSASDASLLAGTETVFVVVIAVVFLRQRLGRGSMLAVLVATCGVLALNGSAPSLAAGWGNLLVLMGTLSAAIYVVLASRIAPSVDALTMTAYQFLAGTILSLPLVLLQASLDGTLHLEAATPGNWLAAIAAGILGLALAFLLYNYAAGQVSATTAGMSIALIPLFGLLGAAVLLGERIDAWQVIGGLLILAGLALFALSQRPGTNAASITQACPADSRA